MLQLNPHASNEQLYAPGDAQRIIDLFETEITTLIKSSKDGLSRRPSLVVYLSSKTVNDDEGIGRDEEDLEDEFRREERSIPPERVVELIEAGVIRNMVPITAG
ncbi:hypothetical protein HDU93_009888 [Gonapodya sp. JEL0774]|nr:hypothetical protein HDU93_009888 [Gonapodya sp. JEL0774]